MRVAWRILCFPILFGELLYRSLCFSRDSKVAKYKLVIDAGAYFGGIDISGLKL